MTADSYIVSYFFVWLDQPDCFFLIADLQLRTPRMASQRFQLFRENVLKGSERRSFRTVGLAQQRYLLGNPEKAGLRLGALGSFLERSRHRYAALFDSNFLTEGIIAIKPTCNRIRVITISAQLALVPQVS